MDIVRKRSRENILARKSNLPSDPASLPTTQLISTVRNSNNTNLAAAVAITHIEEEALVVVVGEVDIGEIRVAGDLEVEVGEAEAVHINTDLWMTLMSALRTQVAIRTTIRATDIDDKFTMYSIHLIIWCDCG